jgi:hypothetical protein
MQTAKYSLVQLSGAFWRVTLDGSQIQLTSTLRGYRSRMTVERFIGFILNGTIKPCGE